MRFEFKPSWHVRTAYPEFYEQMKKEGYVDNYHQLFTYAFLLGAKAVYEGQVVGVEQPKTGDLFMIQNVTEQNLEIIQGIAGIIYMEEKVVENVFKSVLDAADYGVRTILEVYQLDKNSTLLDSFIE